MYDAIDEKAPANYAIMLFRLQGWYPGSLSDYACAYSFVMVMLILKSFCAVVRVLTG